MKSHLFCSLCILLLCSVTCLAKELDPNGLANVRTVSPEVLGKAKIVHVGIVRNDVICLEIRSQSVEHGHQIPYEAKEGDEVRLKGSDENHRIVYRDGEVIGSTVGHNELILMTLDRLVGEELNEEWIDNEKNYWIHSANDRRFGKALHPVHVYRKTKPIDYVSLPAKQKTAKQHFVFLTLSAPMKTGSDYRIRFLGDALEKDYVTLRYDSSRIRSEAVHVSQLGFRPDDPVKLAFLSCWMGNGGGLSYDSGLRFHLLNIETEVSVFSGVLKLSKSKSDFENYENNSIKADLFEMDFSEFGEPGDYRVWVEDVGCSFPFRIAEDVWRKAFYVSVRGLYHQRSGIGLGPPHTNFIRPRSFHPADGVIVYSSDFTHGMDRSVFGDLFKSLMGYRTEEILPNAWGGYMDAADWDRRPSHMDVPRMLLDLYSLAPSFFDSVSLNIPESSDDLPDLLNEALWGVDGFRRLQNIDGGVRSGIESAAHPRHGEGSWQESLTIAAFAANPKNSFEYAGVAARAAYLLKEKDQELSKAYLESAVRAFAWANDRVKKERRRTLAAAELFRATGDEHWHQIFLDTTPFKDTTARLMHDEFYSQHFVNRDYHGEAVWVYTRTNIPGRQKSIIDNYINALQLDAQMLMDGCDATALRWAGHPGRPIGFGSLTGPDAISLIRAHYLTGEKKYLRYAILSCQAGGGANPSNMCYTTGIGSRFPEHPIHEDSRITGQNAPPGLTLFGPLDPIYYADNNWTERVAPYCFPDVSEWPASEAYWDMYSNPGVTEYTVDRPLAPNAYFWGYLAARELRGVSRQD